MTVGWGADNIGAQKFLNRSTYTEIIVQRDLTPF